MVFLTACDLLPEVPTPTPLPDTPTPIPSLTATATPVWFPPTITPTPFNTVEVIPTKNMVPDLGMILLEDPLTSGLQWQLARSDVGGVASGNNELTVTIAKPGGYIYTLRDAPMLGDFYLEINSQTSLCRDEDSYGLIFRAKSSREYYRFVISCAGLTWLEREGGGYTINLSKKEPSGQIQPGPQNMSRIGMMARGKEFRFFINGVFQYSVSDPSYTSGMFGVFARSGGDTAVTVSYKNLVVNALK